MNTENKYSRWVITINPTKLNPTLMSYEQVESLLKHISHKWEYQLEQATTEHWQGCFETHIRRRKSTVLRQIEQWIDEYIFENADSTNHYLIKDQITINPMRGTWEQNIAYCTKDDETKVGPSNSSEKRYKGDDIGILDNDEKRYPWQQTIIQELLISNESSFKTPDDRTIHWIYDPEGCSGKSKLVKWFAVNHDDVCKISFGSATQIRSALITIGPKMCYFIDIPRTLGAEESLSSILSAIEDLKNGYIVSVMYGKYQSLIFDPPHVIIFSNQPCPKEKMSKDRWKQYTMMHTKEFLTRGKHPGNNFGIGQTDS
jgi:hypothetical protein